jgi:hypothetical protein
MDPPLAKNLVGENCSSQAVLLVPQMLDRLHEHLCRQMNDSKSLLWQALFLSPRNIVMKAHFADKDRLSMASCTGTLGNTECIIRSIARRESSDQLDTHCLNFMEIQKSGAVTKDEQTLIKVLALVRQQTRMTCTLQVTQSD